jgi:hypothetical protein
MRLSHRLLEEFDRFFAGANDLEHLQRSAEAAVSAMDKSVPAELRVLIECFVRDLEIARFTLDSTKQIERTRELAAPLMNKLRAQVASESASSHE